MAETFYVGVSDTSPSYLKQLLDADDQPIDLTGATVAFSMRDRITGTMVITLAAAAVVDAADGQVEYLWVASETDVPGFYHVNWRVSYADGSVETFPNYEHDLIQIGEPT